MRKETQISTIQIAIRLALGFIITIAILLGSAGTIDWFEAWTYITLQYSFSIYLIIWLKKNNPELLKERMKFLKSSAKNWDKVIIILVSIASIPLFILPGLDAVRFRWSHVLLPIKIVGYFGIGASFILIVNVVRENAYLYRTVEVLKEREHKVITTGPYRRVRHPMYVGVIVWAFCLPLALGSLWSLLPAAMITVLFIIRIILEEKTLENELEGYRAYQHEVKYRLAPGLW